MKTSRTRSVDTALSHVTAMLAQMAEVVPRTAQTTQSHGRQLAQMEARVAQLKEASTAGFSSVASTVVAYFERLVERLRAAQRRADAKYEELQAELEDERALRSKEAADASARWRTLQEENRALRGSKYELLECKAREQRLRSQLVWFQ